MSSDQHRLYCAKKTKRVFDQIQAQLRAEKNQDLTQDECLWELCESFLKDHPIKIIAEVLPSDPVH